MASVSTRVILISDVHQVGRRGDVIDTKPGYARNFLIPQGLAVRAHPGAEKWFEQQRGKIEAHNEEQISEAAVVAARLDGAVVSLSKRAGENETLYGSVTANDITDGLVEQGFEVDRRHVDLGGGIKTLGEHEVKIALHAEVIALIKVEVTPET